MKTTCDHNFFGCLLPSTEVGFTRWLIRSFTSRCWVAVTILLAALLNCFGEPVITADPQSQTNVVGTDAAFTVFISPSITDLPTTQSVC
jgi:hypothetical protein